LAFYWRAAGGGGRGGGAGGGGGGGDGGGSGGSGGSGGCGGCGGYVMAVELLALIVWLFDSPPKRPRCRWSERNGIEESGLLSRTYENSDTFLYGAWMGGRMGDAGRI
jgi:hypothetical protein